MNLDAFVVFADMLGFASLIEDEGEELSALNPVFKGVELHSPSPADSLLGYRFINFHRCTLKDALPPSVRQRCRHEMPPPVAIDEHHTVACWGRAHDGASLDTSSTPATP